MSIGKVLMEVVGRFVGEGKLTFVYVGMGQVFELGLFEFLHLFFRDVVFLKGVRFVCHFFFLQFFIGGNFWSGNYFLGKKIFFFGAKN
jgi:hypothetical protein